MENNLEFKITRLHRLEDGGNLKAFVDLVVNESLLLKGIRVVEGKSGPFVSMPKEKGKDSRWYETVHPVTKGVKDQISSVVLSAYKENK